MTIRRDRFNINLALLGVLALLVGCQSPEKKMRTQLRVHLEANRDASGRTQAVPVYRDKPFMVNVEKAPFLGETQVAEAKVTDDALGGFSLAIKFERRGTWLLEEYSGANLGKRFAIFCQFPGEGKDEKPIDRWLAAPVITKRISDGVLVFTPDATRSEALRIVRGLNNEAKKHSETDKW